MSTLGFVGASVSVALCGWSGGAERCFHSVFWTKGARSLDNQSDCWLARDFVGHARTHLSAERQRARRRDALGPRAVEHVLELP